MAFTFLFDPDFLNRHKQGTDNTAENRLYLQLDPPMPEAVPEEEDEEESGVIVIPMC